MSGVANRAEVASDHLLGMICLASGVGSARNLQYFGFGSAKTLDSVPAVDLIDAELCHQDAGSPATGDSGSVLSAV